MGWKKELHGWMPQFYIKEGEYPNFLTGEEIHLHSGMIFGIYDTKEQAKAVCNPKRIRIVKVTVTMEEEEPISYMKKLRRKLRNVVKASKN